MNNKFDKYLPKSQSARDILLLVVLIVPLAIAGVVWGIFGDFSEPREDLEPTTVTLPGTPSATPTTFTFIDHA